SKDLTIPHYDIKNRDFVLKPLCELAPWLRHPVTGKTVREMLDELSAK
ncbi:MAG: 2-amino-4-hydroxy-6-hydroxymethyldihydropteridine diphosphokinase, partial [Lachnospiraceae bacterium]|nr:2-amino-4-hydroxy-6-hydroxymethyldihydropteridine diphosphokinase [Lachnospiraceae bacterium]